MPNHVHLILVPADEFGLRDALGEAHRRYTRMINFRAGWRGHLWQERFHSFVMDERHLIAAARYVERNPVRARLCARPEDWPWSSARAHLAGADDALVSVRPLLELISDWARFIDQPDAPDIADLLHAHAGTGRPLGPASFVEALEQSKPWSNASGVRSSDKSQGRSQCHVTLTPRTSLSSRNGIR